MASRDKELALGAILALPQVGKLHARLLAALEAGEPVSLQLGELRQVDAAGLQLLCVFVAEAARRNVPVTFCQPSAALREAVRFLDLAGHLPGLWKAGAGDGKES